MPNEILIPQIAKALEAGYKPIFTVRGRSMRAFLESERDKVQLALPDVDALKPGDVVLAEIEPQHYVLHRIYKRDGEQLVLKGDGNVRGTEDCKVGDVIGIAIAFYRKGRSNPDLVSGRKWRIYSALWPNAYWPRRLCLAFYNRILKRFLY